MAGGRLRSLSFPLKSKLGTKAEAFQPSPLLVSASSQARWRRKFPHRPGLLVARGATETLCLSYPLLFFPFPFLSTLFPLPFRSYPLYSSPFPLPFPSVRFPFLPPLPPLLFAFLFASSFPFPCFFLSVPLAFRSLASPFLSARLRASIRIRQGDTITIRLPGVGATHNHHLAITLTLHHYLTNTPVPRWQLDSPNIC